MGVNTLTEEGWQTLAVEFADGTSYFVTQIKQPAENLNIYDTIHCLSVVLHRDDALSGY